jgi:hypothetical protein
MPAHVQHYAPCRAYMYNELHARALGPHIAPVAAKVISDTICNALDPNILDPLCMLSEPHLPPSHLRFRPHFA